MALLKTCKVLSFSIFILCLSSVVHESCGGTSSSSSTSQGTGKQLDYNLFNNQKYFNNAIATARESQVSQAYGEPPVSSEYGAPIHGGNEVGGGYSGLGSGSGGGYSSGGGGGGGYSSGGGGNQQESHAFHYKIYPSSGGGGGGYTSGGYSGVGQTYGTPNSNYGSPSYGAPSNTYGSPGGGYNSPSTSYGLQPTKDNDDDDDDDAGGLLGGGGGSIAAILGVKKGIKGIKILKLIKLSIVLLPILLPLLIPIILPIIIIGLIILFPLLLLIPIPTIVVKPPLRSFRNFVGSPTFLASSSRMAKEVLSSEECIERISCEIERVARGYNAHSWISMLFEKTPTFIQERATKVLKSKDLKGSCEKYICSPTRSLKKVLKIGS